MIGQTISHYKVLEKLGEGGMGVVYKAEDTKLDRIVALKFLPRQVAATEAESARFVQEARAAAALNHPHACAIYRIDEHDGQQFIEMEFVDGSTLREKVAGGALPADIAIAYAIQIGEALQEAHSKGIVHRDVKSENIMVNLKNQIKVMDFGLAKLKGSFKLTKTSSTVGTLAYMAPEQIQGGEVDARSDIFSFGVVLYEMLTAQLPFRGEHDASMMYSILNEEPSPLPYDPPDSHPEMDRIIRRALEKDPDDRYQHVDDMLSELRRIRKQTGRVGRPPVTGTSPVPSSSDMERLKTGAPVLVKRTSWWFIGGGVMLVVLTLVMYLLLGGNGRTIESLAVLPFEFVGTSAEEEYLSDGITESIINNLTKISSLRVVPRSTAFRFKGMEMDIQEIGSTLNVNAVLSGRVVHRGQTLDVQVDLIDIRRESQGGVTAMNPVRRIYSRSRIALRKTSHRNLVSGFPRKLATDSRNELLTIPRHTSFTCKVGTTGTNVMRLTSIGRSTISVRRLLWIRRTLLPMQGLPIVMSSSHSTPVSRRV